MFITANTIYSGVRHETPVLQIYLNNRLVYMWDLTRSTSLYGAAIDSFEVLSGLFKTQAIKRGAKRWPPAADFPFHDTTLALQSAFAILVSSFESCAR